MEIRVDILQSRMGLIGQVQVLSMNMWCRHRAPYFTEYLFKRALISRDTTLTNSTIMTSTSADAYARL